MAPEFLKKSGHDFGQLDESISPSVDRKSGRRSHSKSRSENSSDSSVEPVKSFRQSSKEGLQRSRSNLSFPSTGGSLLSEPLDVPFILTQRAKLAVAISVLLNAAAMSVEIEAELQFGSSSVLGLAMYGVQCLFLIVFIVELILNVRCHGLSFFYRRGGPALSPDCLEALREIGYKIHFQGIFDCCVVLAATVDLCVMRPVGFAGSSFAAGDAFSAFRVLQLFRLARIFQLLRLSHELSSLAFNLAMSLRAVFWVFLLLFTLIYIGALFCASELGTLENESMKKVFGNIWLSIFSHFKLMTLEQWVDICNAAMEVNPLWAIYFLCFIILTNLTLVNLVTGLIITGVVEHAREDNWTWQERLVEEAPFIRATDDMLKKIGIEEGALNLEAFEMLLSDLQFQAILSLYGISLKLEPKKLFEILSTETPHLDSHHLARSLLQMRGSKQSLHPVLVRHDLNLATACFRERLKDLADQVPQKYHAKVQELQSQVSQHLSTFDSGLRQQLRRAPAAREEKLLSQKLLPSLHSACEAVEVLRGKIAAAAAELRNLQMEEHKLEGQLRRHESRHSRGTQTCHRTQHRN